MKLKLRPTHKDQATKQKLTVKLKKKSEIVRRAELEEASKLAQETKPRDATVRVKITRKGKNLTLNSALGAPKPNTGLPASDAVWQARKMHGRHLPVLACNTCSISRSCPKFKAGYECAYLPYLNSHKVETTEDLVKYMKIMVGNSMKRAQMMSIVEAASGGMPSVETSESLDTAFRQLRELHTVLKENDTDDTIEMEGDSTVIGSLFGGLQMKRTLEETEEMFKNDPMLALPAEVPRAETDKVAQLQAADINTQMLIKEALSEPNALGKKDLRADQMPSISVGSLKKQ